jgi:AbrB family looped-hinge helix DNA binding protein
MSLVTVKNKYQVVIPAKVRKAAGIAVGDLLDATVENGRLLFTPKTVIDRRLTKGIADIRKGRVHGPFDSADEMIESLKSDIKKRSEKAKRKTR